MNLSINPEELKAYEIFQNESWRMLSEGDFIGKYCRELAGYNTGVHIAAIAISLLTMVLIYLQMTKHIFKNEKEFYQVIWALMTLNAALAYLILV